MFTALHTLADVAAKRAPLSSSTITEPGFPSDTDINSSSNEYSLSPHLFKLDLEDEEEPPVPPILPGINHLFDQPKYQQVKLPLVKNLTDITPSDSLWTIHHKEAMAMLTKVINIYGKNYLEQFYKMCMSL